MAINIGKRAKKGPERHQSANTGLMVCDLGSKGVGDSRFPLPVLAKKANLAQILRKKAEKGPPGPPGGSQGALEGGSRWKLVFFELCHLKREPPNTNSKFACTQISIG